MWLVILAIVITVAVLVWFTHDEEKAAKHKRRHWADTDLNFDFTPWDD